MSLNKQIDVNIRVELIDRYSYFVNAASWYTIDALEHYGEGFGPTLDGYTFTGNVTLVNSWKSRRTKFFAAYIPTELGRFKNVTL